MGDHPNIPSAYLEHYENGLGYLVMDYCYGEELSKVKVGPHTIRNFYPLGDAIDYCRRKSIQHLDISDGNLIMGDHPWVIDFDVSNQEAEGRLGRLFFVLTAHLPPRVKSNPTIHETHTKLFARIKAMPNDLRVFESALDELISTLEQSPEWRDAKW